MVLHRLHRLSYFCLHFRRLWCLPHHLDLLFLIGCHLHPHSRHYRSPHYRNHRYHRRDDGDGHDHGHDLNDRVALHSE